MSMRNKCNTTVNRMLLTFLVYAGIINEIE